MGRGGGAEDGGWGWVTYSSRFGLGSRAGSKGPSPPPSICYSGIVEVFLPTFPVPPPSSPQFYAKFTLRQCISEVLQYLWNQPAHKAVWHAFAQVG